MKKPVLVLLVVLAIVSFAQLMAQTKPAAVPPANSAAAPVPDTAQFLATLAGGQAQTPNDLAPAPSFMTGCGYGPACPTGQLCCFLCGNPPDDPNLCLHCVTPIRGRCPLVV
jgi:hypothetical protein